MKSKEIHIGKVVTEICKQKNYKFSEVARKVGISKQTFNSWLKKDDWSVKDLFTVSQVVNYDFFSMFALPNEEKKLQETKVILQIEVDKDKTNEVLAYIRDEKLFNILKQ